MNRTSHLLLAALCCAASASAQVPPPDTLVSPEVHPDRTVTFRIRAPKAAEVTLSGDWLSVGARVAMARNDQGVWEATAGPLEANVHLYFFTVDGVTIADPVNPKLKMRARTSASLVEVPASPAAIWEPRDVPHGSVDVNFRNSKAITYEMPQTWVYLPPDYEKNPSQRYPVLYLLHGTNDVPAAWTTAGAANHILDNLISEKRAKPMIVVMPQSHATQFGVARVTKDAPNGYDYNANNERMDEYVTKELIPWVEAKYRVAPGRENRAIAGLSMGGMLTVGVGLKHLELFSAFGVFSSGARDFKNTHGSLLVDPKATNDRIRLLWIGIGNQDTTVRFETVKDFDTLLTQSTIRHTFRVYDGGAHTWPVWRNCLSEFAPLLFQGKAGK